MTGRQEIKERRTRSTPGMQTVAPPLYETCTVEQAVAAFGDPAKAEFFCGRQFAVFPHATLCFATMGDPDIRTRLLSPTKVSWKPTQFEYHRDDPRPWLPEPLTRCVERNGGWLPLHHMFLRTADDAAYVYAGIAELPMFGDIAEGGRVELGALFTLDAKLPRELWLRLGGYAGWLVRFNNTQRVFAADDVAGFEQLLAGIPAAPGFWEVVLTGYDEHWFTARFNARRAHLRFVPDAERRIRAQGPDCKSPESWDPDCSTPKKREFFGNDGQIDVVYAAGRTVPRELGVRAAVEHFRTGRLPKCVRWRETRF